ncbi:MAG TPA: hypothetical protein VKC11_09775 [Steroidobacteraceae bacterium]|nr:hypothetical protein [Steroidobacteraceae bacterium]
MDHRNKNDLIAARLVRTPWWRTALDRIGGRSQERRYRETLGRLAERDVADTIGEEDLKSWLRMLEGEAEAAPKKPQRPSRP